MQYYFETIFPRIPKTVQDEIIAELKGMGLPTTPKGNAGQGGWCGGGGGLGVRGCMGAVAGWVRGG